jgi:hypothetical protein
MACRKRTPASISGALVATEQLGQGLVDPLEVPQDQRLGVVAAAVEHRPAAGSAAVGEEGVDLWLPPRHGQPHSQRKPVELHLVEPEPGAWNNRISSWVSAKT